MACEYTDGQKRGPKEDFIKNTQKVGGESSQPNLTQIQELFESNPELANEVYSALGFVTPKKTEFTEDEAQIIVNNWKSNVVNLRGLKPSGKELNDLDNAANALLKKLLEVKGQKYTKAPTKATLVTNLFDKTKNKEVDLSKDSPISDLLNIATRFFNNDLYDDDLTSQQKQEAQGIYSQYLDSLNTTELYSKLGNKTESGNVKVVKSIFTNRDNKDVITAFRVDKKLGLLESFRKYNAIGNPINWQDFKPRFGSNLPTSDKTINIYAGSNQNAELSNFVIRPFTTNVETPSGEKQYTFQSVEQGFHFYKALIANNSQVAKQILATTNGGQLKRLTNRSNLKMTSDQVKEWDAISKSIMLNLMYDSYAQNPQAAEKLLITGDAKITHTQDNTRWKTDFPEVVMTVRDMLKEEGFDTQNQPSDNATIAFMDWFLGKDYTNLEQEYRQEILNNLDNLKGKTIEYYKELERPSHATALDYLINQLGSKQDIKGFKEFIQQPNIEQSSAKPVVTKIIDPKPRPVKNSGVVPKSKLQVVENSLTLLEEQQAINIVTDIVYELIQEELIKEGNTKSVKQIYNELFNLPDPNVNELTKQGKAGGKVQIKLRNLYQAWENKESIKSKFAQVMLRLVDVPDGKIKNNKFIRDIITGLKRKGYTVELTQSYDKDGNETWQEKVHETDHFNSISQTLKFKFNLIPKLKIVNGELVVSKGFLGATEYYSSGYVYNHLIKLLSNNPTAELFDKAIQENMNDPIINYLFNYDLGIYSDLNEFENIKTEIFRFIGQSVKWDYYDAVHAKIPNKFEPGLSTVSYVMLSNAKTLKGKIYELIVNNAKMGLLISKGDYNQTAIDNLTKKMLEVKTVEEKIALLKKYSLLPVEVDFIQQELEQDFNQIFNELHRVLTGKKQDLLNILGTKENSVLKSLGALVAKTNQVSLSVNPLHIKDSGKVFEINKPGFLAKLYQTLNKLDSVYQKYLADPLYKNSLLLDLVKQGKATYMIFNSIKLPGKKKNTYYSDSDKRSLMLQYLTMFYPAVKSEGQAFFIANPVQSDAGVQTGTRYETPLLSQEEVIKQLAEVAKRERYGIENPLQTESVVKHHLFPFLEGVAEDKFEEVIAKELIKSKREFLNHLIDLGIIETVKIEATNTTNFYFADGVFSDVSVGTLLNEFYNHYILFQAEQVLLLNGNVSFYEDATKFWKRAKQIWSPLHYLRVGAKWGNFTVRPNFNLAILSDVKKDSPLYAELKERYGDEIAKKYLKNDLADAATYIDLFRAKEIEIASRGWDQEKEDQYQRILSGDFNNKENTPYGAIKPYYFGFHSDGNRLYPFQKKDSVVTLLPYDGIETIGGKENPTFNPLHKIMLEKMGYVFSGETFTPPNEADRFNITKGLVDEFTFESAIKVGGHNINEITIVDDVASNIETDMIVVADNSNYGIQMEVPQHYLDDEQLMARQVVKNFIKGIDKTAIYTLFGQPITGENLIKKFNEVIIKKINASMDELMKRMGSFDKIVELLRTEVQKRELDEKILDALTFTDSTKTATVIPLTHPAYLYDLTGVLHSVFTNRVTKQKLMGGVSYANAASAGYKNPPKIVMENGIIQHFEAFIPISNTLFYKYVKRGEILTLEELREGLKRDGLAEQDIERLLTGLVWRTPNEGMYSNIPIKVAAFFPIERGNSIVLPSEITQIAGLD